MATQRFEVYGSSSKSHDGTTAFLLSERKIVLSYRQLLEAIALYKHKEDLQEDKYLGYKITDDEITLYFKK